MGTKEELKTVGEVVAADTAIVESIVAIGSIRANLRRVLTPEFQGLNPADFMDLTQAAIDTASPDKLRTRLIDVKPDGRSVIGYHPANEGMSWQRISVTAEEFGLFARYPNRLADTAYNRVLASRDKKLQEETKDPTKKAREDEDIAAANRSAVRAIITKEKDMNAYVRAEIEPRIDYMAKFREMHTNHNLTRGTMVTVRERFDRLTGLIFGDMLDALGNQRHWEANQYVLAARAVQWRLFIDPDRTKRLANFDEMLQLAEDYYGIKWALVKGRVAEAKAYLRAHQVVVDECLQLDAQRMIEKYFPPEN